MPYSTKVNPVALPPGRARLATMPAATGSLTFTNTTGTWRVTCSSGVSGEFPLTTMASGASATSSEARRRQNSPSPKPTRGSIWMVRPTIHRSSCRP
jgi:hypothetical protein